MADLKTNYVDDKLNASTNQLRKYQQIKNDDGTVSFVDVTDYTETGTSFGAKDINATNKAVNKNTTDIVALNKSMGENFNSLNKSLNTEANTRDTEDAKLTASIAEVATSVSTATLIANTANKTALSAIRAMTKNIVVTVSNGVATIPFSSVGSGITASNYIDALIDIFSSNDYMICRKWKSGTNIYAFIRRYDGTVLTSGNLTFQVTAFITM